MSCTYVYTHTHVKREHTQFREFPWAKTYPVHEKDFFFEKKIALHGRKEKPSTNNTLDSNNAGVKHNIFTAATGTLFTAPAVS